MLLGFCCSSALCITTVNANGRGRGEGGNKATLSITDYIVLCTKSP